MSACIGWIQSSTLSHLGKVVTGKVVTDDSVQCTFEEKIVSMRKYKGWQGTVSKEGEQIKYPLMKIDAFLIRKFIEDNPEHAFSKLGPEEHIKYGVEMD